MYILQGVPPNDQFYWLDTVLQNIELFDNICLFTEEGVKLVEIRPIKNPPGITGVAMISKEQETNSNASAVISNNFMQFTINPIDFEESIISM